MQHYQISYANLLEYVEKDHIPLLQNVKTKDGQTFDYFSPEEIDGMIEREFREHNSEVIAVLSVSAELLSRACEDLRAHKPTITKIADLHGGVEEMLRDLELYYAGCQSMSFQIEEDPDLRIIMNAKMRRGYFVE